MLKKTVSLLLICGIFLLPASVLGQSELLRKTTVLSSNLKQAFAEETAKIKSDETDFKKLEREQMKSAFKSKWTTQQKTLLWAGIGAAIAATIIIVAVSRKDNDSASEGCYVTCTAIGCPPPPPCP